MPTLAAIAIMLFAAIVAVRLSSRFGFGAVLGYLVAGMAMGPHGLKLIGDPSAVLHVAEFGVVMLLFIIGLELKPQRLWVMRRQVFGLGGLQVVATTAVFGLIGWSLGFNPAASGIAGLGLALSSTAFVLPILGESGEISAAHGRSSFAILLFQDIAVIPAMALIPLMGVEAKSGPLGDMLLDAGRAIAAILLVILLGRQVVRHFLRIVAETRNHELFVITALFIVLGTAALMEAVGLSMSLGAFLAGVLLADSEYRHELQADIEPFKGVMLGLFFMAVGMTIDFAVVLQQPLQIVLLLVGFLALKALVLWGMARVLQLPVLERPVFIILLAQGGEFGFVVFQAAAQAGVITASASSMLVATVALSMLLSPLLLVLADRVLVPRLQRELRSSSAPMQELNEPQEAPIIIAGFGRYGQIVGRLLYANGLKATVLDHDAEAVEALRKFGWRVFYGDATRLDLLRTAGASTARVLVLAIDDAVQSLKVAEIAREHFPQMTVVARARNVQHYYALRDLGVQLIERETLDSALMSARSVLETLGWQPHQARTLALRFRRHNLEQLAAAAPHWRDEAWRVANARTGRQQLEELFAQEREEARVRHQLRGWDAQATHAASTPPAPSTPSPDAT